MNRLANRISDYLIGLGLDASEKEIYTYAIEGLLNSIFIFGSILAIGAALHKLHIALIWMLFFLPVRHTTGGIHANSNDFKDFTWCMRMSSVFSPHNSHTPCLILVLR